MFGELWLVPVGGTSQIAFLVGMLGCAPAFRQLKAAAAYLTSNALLGDDFSSIMTGAAADRGGAIHTHGFVREFL